MLDYDSPCLRFGVTLKKEDVRDSEKTSSGWQQPVSAYLVLTARQEDFKREGDDSVEIPLKSRS